MNIGGSPWERAAASTGVGVPGVNDPARVTRRDKAAGDRIGLPGAPRAAAPLGVRMAGLLPLFRPRVSLVVGLSSLFGYLLARPVWDAGAGVTLLGVMLLAAGCSAVNQAQEHSTDALMARTASRPVPLGRCTPLDACRAGAGAIALALVALFLAGGMVLGIIGVGITGVYNGLYTPLKKRSSLALLVGAFVGALPPVVGWLAAGGPFPAPFPILLYGAFFLWQVPHFWLRVVRDREEYVRAGLPVLSIERFALPGLFPVPLLWEYALTLALVMLADVSIRDAALLKGALVIAVSIPLRGVLPPRYAAWVVDGAMAAVMGLVLADRLLY